MTAVEQTHVIKEIVKNRVIVCRNTKVFVRHIIPEDLRAKGEMFIKNAQQMISHPNILMTYLIVRYDDGNTDVDVEYMDRGTMKDFIPKIAVEHRDLVAMSVMRQILHAIAYLDIKHDGKRHRHICPRYVYLRSDGCIKLDIPEMYDQATVERNQPYFLDSPYTAPECRATSKDFFAGDYRSDLWSLGVLIVAIMTGCTMQPRRADETSTEEELHAYSLEQVIFKKLITSNDDNMWKKCIPNDYIRYFTRRFLQISPMNRGTAIGALALTYVFGGVAETTTTEFGSLYFEQQPFLIMGKVLPHPWSLDVKKAFITPTVPDLAPFGMYINDCLRCASIPYILPPDTRGEKDLVVPINVQAIAAQMAFLLNAELINWRDIQAQNMVNRAMRDVLRNRSLMSMRVISHAVNH